MSLQWPPDLRFLTYIVGQAWPDGDEDRMFAMAQCWLEAANDIERQVVPVVRTAESLALAGYESGAGRDNIAAELDRLVAGDNSIARLAADYRDIGTSTRHAATTIEETKLMIILSVTMLAAQLAGAWLWPPTAPAVEAAAIGATRASLYRITNRALDAIAEIPLIGEHLADMFRYLPRLADEPGRISRVIAQPATALVSRATPELTNMLIDAGFRETTALALAELPADTVKFLIEKAVNNTIWAGGLDIAVQEIQIGKGHRDGLDGLEIGMSIAASTGGWYAGALVATTLSKYGGKLLTGWGKDPTAGVWGAGLGVLSGTVPTVVSTLVGGGIAELFTGTFDPRIGLIGAVSSNSLMGMQRGSIGMLGREPAATRFDRTVTHRTEVEFGPAPEPTGPPRPLKSSADLLEQIRQRDAPEYRDARTLDRVAARSGGGSDEGPQHPRAFRNAHLDEQRALVRDLTGTRRGVLNAELDHARARARAAALPDPEARAAAVNPTRERLEAAVAADTAMRAHVQARLTNEHAEAPARPGPAEHTPPPETPEPSAATIRGKLAAADDHIERLRSAHEDTARTYTRADRRGLSTLNEHQTAEREALGAAKTAREATRAELATARTEHGQATPEQRPGAQARVTELEQTVRAQERDIENRAARLALTDHELGMTRSRLESAAGAQDRAITAAGKALDELDGAGRAAAAARDRRQSELDRPHPAQDRAGDPAARPPSPRSDELEHLQGEIQQRRTHFEQLRSEHDALLLKSGITENRLRTELAQLDNSLRTERTLLDGGYMSGKPKPRKRPLEHGMPDQFTALPPPDENFWLTGGIIEQPQKPEPEPVHPGHPPHHGRPPHPGHPPHHGHPRPGHPPHPPNP
ncbi:hypothetical protein GFY24_18225 [Nocardia sp. SYP-A9097]|uniref:WXG100-like domain-containing protein n=1 Tax=Nocardia sp. SYP-A9097 TaxID=2663237 RepID=UPI00129AF14C|nr:hypothetical protein [Nocardia sp. SYP-A9097]MRH89361.1 hypothetical protein [Nocardia sp. SYP-A9097]